MGSPQHYVKPDIEDNSYGKSDRARDDTDLEGDDWKKHRVSKSRKQPGNGDEAEGIDSSGRKISSSGDIYETRKRSDGSSRAGSDEDDCEARKESRSKQMKRKQEESSLEKLSNWYQDGEFDNNKNDGGDKTGSREHVPENESERRKSSSKFSDHEGSQGRIRSDEGEVEKVMGTDLRYTEKRRESGREVGHGSSEQGRNRRTRWEDTATIMKAEERNYMEKSDLPSEKLSDPKHASPRERCLSDKDLKFADTEEIRADTERSKSKGRPQVPEEDSREGTLTCEDGSGKERIERHRQQTNPTNWDVVENHERSLNADEDGNAWMRDKNRREIECSKRSRSPDRSGRHFHESESFEIDYERSSTFRRKETEQDGYKDDRSRGRDDSWSDRNRDREGSRDNWKRRQPSSYERETKDGDMVYDYGREWELQRHGRDRFDKERPQGRSGGRKDNRTEAVKTSSNYGITSENYDVIEIQTKPFDCGRDPESTFVRKAEVGQQSEMQSAPKNDEWAYPADDRARKNDMYASGQSGDASKERFMDDGPPMQDQNSWRDDVDFPGGKARGQKSFMSNRTSGGSQPPYGNQELASYGRAVPQGNRGSRIGRGGRGRPSGRDSQQLGLSVPMVGSPFGPLGMPPPGPMQPLTPCISPAPGPPMSPNVFIPPYSPPIVWPGARGIDANILGIPPGLSPLPPGPSGPRFPPSMGTPPNTALFFNQPGPGRGDPLNISGPSFNAMVSTGRGQSQDKVPGGWAPSRNNGPPGKAPSRGEQNDYSQNFVDTGMRPQNFIRELELTNVVEDYPKLRELIQRKDEIVAKSASPPMYYKCDLREFVLSPEFFGTKFDVILVDPPWEEYVHRAPGVTDHMEYWTLEQIMNLKIEAIADTPSFIFLWVGDGVGLEQGRQCLKKWGFRRCEDICWVKRNKTNATPGLRHDSHTLFQRSKEHCLMGIKGTVRRSTDGHIIHANIDTDVIIAEEPPYGSTAKPEDMYRIVEHFSLGRRRLELFGEDHNIRSGWLTVGKELSSSNFNAEAFLRGFADKDGKVWQGGGGRNPPPEAPHLIVTTPEIEALRPKSPMKNQQQQQQQSTSLSLVTSNSTNQRSTGNSPQNHIVLA